VALYVTNSVWLIETVWEDREMWGAFGSEVWQIACENFCGPPIHVKVKLL